MLDHEGGSREEVKLQIKMASSRGEILFLTGSVFSVKGDLREKKEPE